MSRFTKHFYRSKFDRNDQKRREHLGKLLCAAREEAELTQEIVAVTLGYKHQYDISQIENGKRTLDAVELETLAHLYGKTLNDFSTWLNTQPSTEQLRQRAEKVAPVLLAARKRSKKKQQHKQQMDALARQLFEA